METAIVFGGGLSGVGAKELLEKNGYKVFLIDDKNGLPTSEGIKILNAEKVEFIVKSPGIPWTAQLLVEAKNKNIKVISEIDLAYKYMDKSTKIIAFTGTNGKTTTAVKTYELLKFAGENVELAGNAGFSFAKLVSERKKLDYVVLELSSYQLENNPTVHPNIAGNINLTPDHLSRYESLEDYYLTKFNIYKNQNENDYTLINLEDVEFQRLYRNLEVSQGIKGKKIFLSGEKRGTIFVENNSIYAMKNLDKTVDSFLEKGENRESLDDFAEKIIPIKELSLKGKHNLENMLFVIGVGKILNISNEVIKEFLKNTAPLEHRLENFFVKGNTTFVNDSKGTNVESTLKAIDSFDNKIILILGGDDKKVSNVELVKKIKEKVDFVYLIGENALMLIEDMKKVGYENYKNLETLENVLNYIKENENFEENKTILLSPATSSWCQFESFEHRGRVFKELTQKLIK